jgi:hypothetical protein
MRVADWTSRILVAAGVGCVAFLAAGCVESTWTWTLNPDGKGKVEIDARLQPPIAHPTGRMRLADEKPDELAKGLAREVLKESRGLAAWRDVSCGVAEDGRIAFSGTAYFEDALEVAVRGEPFPASVLKPSLTREDGGRLVVGLRFGHLKTGPRRDRGEAEPAGEGPAEEPTEDLALKVRKGKVGYQTIKPIMTAFLSTMRTEMVVRPPGEVVEASGFEKLEGGDLRLVFDGQGVLNELDRWAEEDAAKWRDFVLDPDEDRGRKEELRSRLVELLFGEMGPVRAVVSEAAGPLFDYEGEVAEAKDGYGRVLDEFGLEGPPRGREGGQGYRPYWNLTGGAIGSARTDSGTGRGWTVAVGGGERDAPILGDYFFEVQVSHIEYEEDVLHPEMSRVVLEGGLSPGWCRVGGGFALSFGQGDIWAAGPELLCGVGYFGRRAEIGLVGSVYAWFGERDDEFDIDAEADLRLTAGLRF